MGDREPEREEIEKTGKIMNIRDETHELEDLEQDDHK